MLWSKGITSTLFLFVLISKRNFFFDQTLNDLFHADHAQGALSSRLGYLPYTQVVVGSNPTAPIYSDLV